MYSRKRLLHAAALMAFVMIFIGYSILYINRFILILPFVSNIGFSHSVLAGILLLLPGLMVAGLERLYQFEKIFLIWILFAVMYAILAVGLGAPSHSLLTQGLGFAQALGLWLVFRSLAIDTRAVMLMSFVALIACGFAVLASPETVTVENAELFSYHTTALVIFLTGYLLASRLSMRYAVIMITVTLIFLYINGARTEFYLFALIAPIVAFRKAGMVAFLLGGVIGLVGLATSLLNRDRIIHAEGASRTLGLLNLSHDASYNERVYILKESISTILYHPITGSYASYKPGYYSHNALSAWVDFGIIGFIVYLTCVLMIIRAAIILFRADRIGNLPVFALTLALVASIALSKAYFHPMMGCVVGILFHSRHKMERVP